MIEIYNNIDNNPGHNPGPVKILNKFDLIRGQLKNQFPTGKIEHLGKGFFLIDFPAITCVGANVTQYFTVPFLHKLHRFEVKHTDSVYADSVNALTYVLSKGSTIRPDLLFALITNTATVITDTAHLFTDFWRAQTRYRLVTNSTNTDLLFVSLLVEIEDEPDMGRE